MNKKDKSKGRIFHPKGKKRKENDDGEIEKLTLAFSDSSASFSNINSFGDLPLSARTLKGLKENNYIYPTRIQKESILAALQGSDVLGSAKTGSGKTLAFLVPVLDILYCRKWSRLDGVGAVIITPTRELALQIYETLVRIGKYHDVSAALVIGGKDLAFERNRMNHVNIIICTPGRLLQHMDQTAFFTCTTTQVLVLDEADRCLDLGFRETIDSILANIPESRQTLLFSATQTNNVKDLARLNLKNPWCISVDEDEEFKTPNNLKQTYIVCEHHDKIALLWSFVRSHNKQKAIIFLSTCNQVKYYSELFKKMRPTQQLFCLQGKIHQLKRIDIYHAFQRKEVAVLFATDVAARGLDFPNVDWVVQGDCPENVEAYIHRVGRTARYNENGESLLVLAPSELRMLEKLKVNRIPITEIRVNPVHILNPQVHLELFLAKNNDLKSCAQRAFVSYFKSVFLMKDKTIFDVKNINPHNFARSMGLIAAPRVRFIQRKKKNNFECHHHFGSDLEEKDEKTREKILQKKKIRTEAKDFNFLDDDYSDVEECTFSLKRQNHGLQGKFNHLERGECSNSNAKPIVTKAQAAKRILRRIVLPNKKIIFNDGGQLLLDYISQKVSEEGINFELADDVGFDLPAAQKAMLEEDKHDRKRYAELSKARRREKKLKEKSRRKKEREEEEEEEEDKGSESSGGSEPDLSWLPDPDKVYRNNEEEAVSHQTSSRSEQESESNEPKRKLPAEFESDSEDDLGLTLGDKEDLALKLISLKK